MTKPPEQLREEYSDIFGEDHHKICEGKKCECHKVVWNWILKNFTPKK